MVYPLFGCLLTFTDDDETGKPVNSMIEYIIEDKAVDDIVDMHHAQ
jgi:hypothetical protein